MARLYIPTNPVMTGLMHSQGLAFNACSEGLGNLFRLRPQQINFRIFFLGFNSIKLPRSYSVESKPLEFYVQTLK